MSNFLAVASVTAVLRNILSDAVNHTGSGGIPGALVTTLRPDLTALGGSETEPRLNVYLYQVTPNAAERNVDLPTRASGGQPRIRPCAALDLHYLLSFFGDDSVQEPQRLLGIAVAALHARPILSPTDFRNAQRASGAPGFLALSDLDSEIHEVRLTPLGYSLDDLSRLWSVLLQARYVLSVAYRASVVFVEADLEVTTPRPVRRSVLTMFPFRKPAIDSVTAEQTNGGARPTGARIILAGDTLRVQGSGLGGQAARALVDDVEQPLEPGGTDAVVALRLPAGLESGIHRLQIVQTLALGTPSQPRRMFGSNVVTFALQPCFAVDATTVSSHTVDGQVLSELDIDVSDINPPIAPGQQVSFSLLSPTSTDRSADPANAPPAHAYAVDVRLPAVGAPPNGYVRVSLHVGDVVSGEYLAILQVDGAESPVYFADTPPPGWRPLLKVQ